MQHIDSKDILIRMLSTPNPYALKFVLNVPVKNKGRATLYNKQDCEKLKLFYSLFDITAIKQIYAFQNQITITHDGSLIEEDMEKQVTAIVKTRIALHDPDFLSFEETEDLSPSIPSKKKEISPEILQVEEILDRTVRPGLRADGGDLEVISVQGDEVRITYQGACGGCPSAMMGTLEAIEGILRHEMKKENLRVIPLE